MVGQTAPAAVPCHSSAATGIREMALRMGVHVKRRCVAKPRRLTTTRYPYLGIQWGTHASPARAHAFLSVLPRRRLQQHPYLERVFAGFEFSVSFSVRVPPPGRPLADSIQRRVLRNVGESVPKTTLLSQGGRVVISKTVLSGPCAAHGSHWSLDGALESRSRSARADPQVWTSRLAGCADGNDKRPHRTG